ncbi:MAG: hypothetical protein JO352_03165 [Chloroflexi bacterium]|nr:hypothetical protein [Chloroflexota bacterium]
MHSQRRDRTAQRSAINGGNQVSASSSIGSTSLRDGPSSRTGITRNRRRSAIHTFAGQQRLKHSEAVGHRSPLAWLT